MSRHLTSAGDGSYSTPVWDGRVVKRNYSGLTYKEVGVGSFWIYGWSSSQGNTIYCLGQHVKWDGGFPQEGENAISRETFRNMMQKVFLDNVPMFALIHHMADVRAQGAEEGRKDLQGELKVMLDRALGNEK